MMSVVTRRTESCHNWCIPGRFAKPDRSGLAAFWQARSWQVSPNYLHQDLPCCIARSKGGSSKCAYLHCAARSHSLSLRFIHESDIVLLQDSMSRRQPAAACFAG